MRNFGVRSLPFSTELVIFKAQRILPVMPPLKSTPSAVHPQGQHTIFRNILQTPTNTTFSKGTAVQMGGALQKTLKAHCTTNRRCITGFPRLQGLEARKTQQYTWGACCGTNWRCTAVPLKQAVRVGGSWTLPTCARHPSSQSIRFCGFAKLPLAALPPAPPGFMTCFSLQ